MGDSMKVLAVDENSDAILKNGRYVFVEGIEAVKTVCQQVMKAQVKQYQYDQTRGIEYFGNVFDGNPNFQAFEAQARSQLLSISNVVRVLSFDYSFDGTALSYTAQIQTTFGSGVINGNV